MEQQDSAGFLRLDNATVVDFLTSIAGVLCEQAVLSSKDSDNLRLVLSGIGSAGPSRENPILIELEKQDAEFLACLRARFGQAGLCLNLLRHTLRAPVEELQRAIAAWVQQLLKKSELLFNRGFYIYDGSQCEKSSLYSSVIVEFSEQLAETYIELGHILEALARMHAADLAGTSSQDTAIDEKIAAALGFTSLFSPAFIAQSESALLRRLAQALLEVAHASSTLATQLSANTASQSAYAVAAACDSLTAECQRLVQLELPRSASLMVWEMRRRSIIASLSSIQGALRNLVALSLECLGQEVKAAGLAHIAAVQRRLSCDLIAQGITPQQADTAARCLLAYLNEQKIQPKQVLVGELGRIHPALRASSLETLTALEADTNLMSLATMEKSHTSQRARRLLETFKNVAQASASICVFVLAASAFSVSGCGFKTNPSSDIPELRPDVPFKPRPASSSNPESSPNTAPATISNPFPKP